MVNELTTAAKELLGVECRFAVHVPSKHPDMPDIHLIKEQRSYKDGTTESKLRFIKNFKRPFYITNQSKRNHKDKKEFEYIDNLMRKEVTQSKLRDEVARLLGKGWSKDSIRQLAESPYLYGTDISSTALIKKLYIDKYPNLATPYSICTYDIETDVLHGTEDPIIATSVFQNKIHCVIVESFIKGYTPVYDHLNRVLRKELGSDTEGKYEVEFELATDTVDLIRKSFYKVHEWKPDFLAIWNMNFDIPRILDTLKKYDVDPKDILCDPSVPEDYRICRYKKGADKKVTSSGKVKPVNPAMQWHTLFLTASFYVIDAMCSYRYIRITGQEDSSYALDAILNKEKIPGKLKFKEAEKFSGLAWHIFMQEKHPIEYTIYNIADSLRMMQLEEQTKDLSYVLPSSSFCSDFSDFKSQPKKITDAIYFHYLARGKIVGSTPPKIEEPEELKSHLSDEDSDTNEDDESDEEKSDYDDNETLDLRNWILTLPSHMQVNGLNIISEDPTISTNIRAFVFDSDAVSSYPTVTSVCNVSKATTLKELITIEGYDEDIFRKQNLNLVLGSVNALEYSQIMFKMAMPHELLSIME